MLALRSQRRVCGRGLARRVCSLGFARRGLCARAGRAEQFLHQRQQRIEDGESSNPMVVRVSSSNSDLYLIGTRHEDPRSANIVRSIIGIVKPHATAIEQRGGTSYLKGVRADNNEFAVATQLGSKHGRVVPIDIAVFDALAGVERTTPLVQLVEARIGHTIDVMCLETFCFEHPRLKQTSETRIYMEERDETMAAALRPFVYSEPREGGTGRCVAVVGRAHIVGIVNKLLSEPKPIANPSTDDVYTDNLDVRRSLFDTMYGGAVGGTLNRKDGPFGYVEKSEAATEFFEMALSGEAIFRAWLPLISADAITNETLSIVARRLLDAFEAGHDPFYTMVTASREVLQLNASGAVSHSSSWLRRMFNVGPKLHIDHEAGLTSLAGAELDRLTEILSRQRSLAATKDVTLTNIVPRFKESECVDLTPLALAEMDLNDVEQVSKWMYH